MKKLLLTGSSGLIGGIVKPVLEESYEVLTLDIADNGKTDFVADIADYEQVNEALKGIDTVVHLAANKYNRSFDELYRPNIKGTANVFRAAEERGVRRVIFASSVRADEGRLFNKDYNFNEDSIDLETRLPKKTFSEEDVPEPIIPYGISKTYGELLAQRFAQIAGKSADSLRIGAVQSSDELPKIKSELNLFIRYCYLSHGDLQGYFKALMKHDKSDYEVFYLVSNNRYNLWSPEKAMRILGYEPKDSDYVFMEFFGRRKFNVLDRYALYRMWSELMRDCGLNRIDFQLSEPHEKIP